MREAGREGGRIGGRKEGSEGGKEGEREKGRKEEASKGGRKEGSGEEEGRKEGRERGREGGKDRRREGAHCQGIKVKLQELTCSKPWNHPIIIWRFPYVFRAVQDNLKKIFLGPAAIQWARSGRHIV